MGLSEVIHDETIQARVAADCARLMDEQVSTKGGIAGLAIKTTYGMLKGLGADYIPGAIQRLLPDACVALEPIWQEGLAVGNPVEHLDQHRARTADMILGITDARIERSNNKIVRASYGKLRQSVKGDIEAAIPGLAQILSTHTQGA